MKIAFIGAVEFSRRTLELLVEMKQDIVGVCTLKDSLFNADHFDLSSICRSNSIFVCLHTRYQLRGKCQLAGREKNPMLYFVLAGQNCLEKKF